MISARLAETSAIRCCARCVLAEINRWKFETV